MSTDNEAEWGSEKKMLCGLTVNTLNFHHVAWVESSRQWFSVECGNILHSSLLSSFQKCSIDLLQFRNEIYINRNMKGLYNL